MLRVYGVEGKCFFNIDSKLACVRVRFDLSEWFPVNIGLRHCQEPPIGNQLPQLCGVNYQLLAIILPKQQNGRLQAVVDHSQLRTMASEEVHPIDWPLPPPFTGQ